MSEKLKLIKLWKENNLGEARFIFTCGGDSMGYTGWEFADAEGNDCAAPDGLEKYLDDEVYNRVDFYVDSDGHYCGEAGTVTVTLEDDTEDEEDWDFCFSKSSTSEWSESHISKVGFKLTEAEAQFVKAHVLNINGSSDEGIAVNYKHDFIMSDDDENLLNDLQANIEEFLRTFYPDDAEGELQEWYTYSTNENRNEVSPLTVEGDNLIIYINNSMTIFKPED